MKSLVLALVVAGALSGQAPSQPSATAPAKPLAPPSRAAALMSLPPETVVATIDGAKVLAVELQVILRARQGQQDAMLQDPRVFLEQFGLMRRLSAMAEKAGLDQKSPLKDQLSYTRMATLAPAELQAYEEGIKVTSEEVQKAYESNKDQYATARVKVIYIPFSANPPATSSTDKKILSEVEAKTKVEKLQTDLVKGADFVKAVKENSGDAASAAKDGDFGTLRRSDQLPEEIKAAVFSLKAGGISQPVRQANGFYIFRVEEIGVEPLDRARSGIETNLRTGRFNDWVRSIQKSLDIKFEKDSPFQAAAPGAVQ